jgi:uncharacterized protein HemX
MTIVLVVVVVVLVLAAGLFVTLFVMEKGAVSDANAELSSTEQQLKAQNDNLSDTKSEADDLESQGKDLQATHDYMQKCADSSKASIQAAQSGTDQQLSDAIDQMLLDCVRQGDT